MNCASTVTFAFALACCSCKYDRPLAPGGTLPGTVVSPTVGAGGGGVATNPTNSVGVQSIGTAGTGSALPTPGNLNAGDGTIPSTLPGIAGSSAPPDFNSTIAGTIGGGFAGVGSFSVPGSSTP
jgi:hypothetical protein